MSRWLVGVAAVLALAGTLVWAGQIDDEVRDNLKKLDPTNFPTRVLLAKAAMEKQAWEGAYDALTEATRINPTDAEALSLLAEVKKHLPAPTVVPATMPAGPATKPVTAEPKGPPPGLFLVKREVTATEINRIRQLELGPDEKASYHIDPAVKKKFKEMLSDPTPAEFDKMSADEQAALIISKGKPAMRDGVKVVKDPASVAAFKAVQKTIVSSCATAGCHVPTNPKNGGFVLYSGASDQALYTNFLELQKTAPFIRGVQRPLVDRSRPETSILLQFMVDAGISDAPHPPVGTTKVGSLKSKGAAGFQSVLHWIESLRPLEPEYGIDLSTDDPTTAPKKK